jgi:hypothetical protein
MVEEMVVVVEDKRKQELKREISCVRPALVPPCQVRGTDGGKVPRQCKLTKVESRPWRGPAWPMKMTSWPHGQMIGLDLTGQLQVQSNTRVLTTCRQLSHPQAKPTPDRTRLGLPLSPTQRQHERFERPPPTHSFKLALPVTGSVDVLAHGP